MPCFDEFAFAWLQERKISSRTRANYSRLLLRHLVPAFGGNDLRDISATEIDRWYFGLAVDTPTVQSHAYLLLRSIMRSASEGGFIDANPCRIEGVSTSGRVHEIRPTNGNEVAKITAAMPEAYRALLLMALLLAMRFSELCELRRKDVDFGGGVVRVRRSVMLVDEVFQISTPKSAAGMRDIFIPPHMIPMLKTHLAKHVTEDRESLLFPAATDPHRHLKPQQLHSMIKSACRAAGRPDLRVTDLRHFAADLSVSNMHDPADN